MIIKPFRSLIVSLLAISILTPCTALYAAKHKIKQGDSLWVIAKKNHVSVKDLCKANKLKESSTLDLGDTIKIPEKDKPHKSIKKKYSKAKTTRVSRFSTRHIKTANRIKYANKNVQVASLPSSDASSLIKYALACRGSRYVSGGTSRSGFDCSGFTRYVYARFGKSLPHSSAAQASCGVSVSRSELKAGDILLFQTYRRGVSHVGIYVGNGNFVHAANHGRGVTIDSINSSYYAPRYRGARRLN